MTSSSSGQLGRNIGHMAAGNLVFAACQWLVLVALARLGGAQQVGEFALAMAVVSPVLIFSQFALRGVVATDQRDERPFHSYFSTRQTTTAVAIVLLLGALPLLGYGARINTLIALLALARGAEAISDIYYALGQKHERLDINARSLALRGLLSTSAFSIGCYAGKDVLIGTALYTLVWIVMALGYDRRATAPLRPATTASAVAFSERLEIVRNALPLGLVLTFATINTNIPRLVVESELGRTELGYYAAISQIIIAGLIVITAFGQSALPRLSGYLQADNRVGFTRLFGQLVLATMAIAMIGIVATYFVGEWVLGLLYGVEFVQQGSLFMYLALAALPHYVGHIASYAATACRLFKLYAACYGLGVLATLVAALVLIPHFGTAGAAGVIAVTGFANLLTALTVVTVYFRRQRYAK